MTDMDVKREKREGTRSGTTVVCTQANVCHEAGRRSDVCSNVEVGSEDRSEDPRERCGTSTIKEVFVEKEARGQGAECRRCTSIFVGIGTGHERLEMRGTLKNRAARTTRR